jgi:hypothetical protein
MSNSNGKTQGKRRGGAPKGNKNALKHGLVALQNQVKRRVRRGRDRIDKRTSEGQEALQLRSGYILERGGLDNLSTVEFGLIIRYSENWYLRAIQYNSIFDYIKENPHIRSNPRIIDKLTEYAERADDRVKRCEDSLGIEKKPPPTKSLEEILAEESEDSK